MQLLTLTQIPSELEQQLFQQLLVADDVLLLTGRALPLCYRARLPKRAHQHEVQY